MLLDQGLMPLITKATRITNHTSTLIDHIYTNIPQKVLQARICLADITDLFPVFCTVSKSFLSITTLGFLETLQILIMNYFYDIRNVDFNGLINNDVNESMYNVMNTLQEISDKHARCAN